MIFFHRHSWTEIERIYARPRKITTLIDEALTGMSEDLARQLLFGVTTIVYRCSECGAIKKLEVLGKAQPLVIESHGV